MTMLAVAALLCATIGLGAPLVMIWLLDWSPFFIVIVPGMPIRVRWNTHGLDPYNRRIIHVFGTSTYTEARRFRDAVDDRQVLEWI